jgi:hypothetical protein
MWLLLLLTAVRADPVHVEVSLASEDGGLLNASTAWVRLKEGCILGQIADATLAVPICEDRPKLTCTASAHLGETWTGWSSFQCERPNGTGWGGAWGGSFHNPPWLIENSANAARWQQVHKLTASVLHHRSRSETCQSGETRSCNTSTGVRISQRALRAGAGGIGMTVETTLEVVDCTVPCERNADLERVQAISAVLAEAHYSDHIFAAALFATEEACLEGQATELVLPTDVCTD